MSKLLAKAEQLYKQGFQPIPTVYKKPIEANWQTTTEEPNGNFNGANGIGIVLGREVNNGYVLALDVDCLNKTVSNDFYEWICSEYGQYPFRIGTKPKFMIPFICDERLTKTTTPWYDKNSRVELLGNGQQFVAYGFADKGIKYNWFNGELNLNTLPLWSAEDVKLIMAKWETLALKAGMNQEIVVDSEELEDDFLIDVPSNKEDITFSELKQLLTKLNPNDLPYEQTGWIEVGMALHHQTEGSEEGLNLWIEWSRQSNKHGEKCSENCMRKKWRSFDSVGKRVVTLATVRQLINQQYIIDMDNPFDDIELPDINPDSTTVETKRFYSASAIQTSELTQFWQVEDVLEKGSVAQIFGPSYSGKSYLTLYLAACIASGEMFGDKRTVKSKVLYVYGEGNHGIKRRIQAIKTVHPHLNMDDLIYSPELPNFMEEKSFLKFGKDLKAFGGVDVIIVDTLARAMSGGDENSAMDIGIVLKRLAKLRDVFGCSVVIVHHTGHGATERARGSSANYAGMDNEIKVTKTDEGFVSLESTKAKDSPEYSPMFFQFVPVHFSVSDNFGRDITSAAVQFYDGEMDIQRRGKLSPAGMDVLLAFEDLEDKDEYQVSPPSDFSRDSGLNSPAFGLLSSDVREQFNRRMRDSATADSTIRQKWKRGLQDAVSKGVLCQLDEIIVRL